MNAIKQLPEPGFRVGIVSDPDDYPQRDPGTAANLISRAHESVNDLAMFRSDPITVYRNATRMRGLVKPVTVFSSGLRDCQLRRLVRHHFGNDHLLHRGFALRYWKRMKRYQTLYNRALDLASQRTFGRPFTFGDYRVSGIGRDEFESKDKDRIRRFWRLLHDYEDLAHAHATAGGRAGAWCREFR